MRPCWNLGLLSAVPPNSPPNRLYTYRDAQEICQQQGMVMRNSVDPWTSSCSTPFISDLTVLIPDTIAWDINDKERKDPIVRNTVACTILNWSKCSSLYSVHRLLCISKHAGSRGGCKSPLHVGVLKVHLRSNELSAGSE